MKSLFLPLLIAGLSVALLSCSRTAATVAAPASSPVQAIVVAAKLQPVFESLSLVGTLVANEMVEIKSETDGMVEKIFLEEGSMAKQGDLLVQLDESKHAAAVAEAEANFQLSKAIYDRTKQLLDNDLIAQQEFDQAAAIYNARKAALDLKKREWRDTRIYAPFPGVVSSRQVSPGQVISKNTTLTWLIDLDPVKVEVGIPERFLAQIRLDQELEISVAAFPDRKFAGRVFFVAPYVDPLIRTALVKARVPNPQRELKPGMFANLNLTLRFKEQALVIPESAVVPSGDRNVVYVVDSEDTAQIRPVLLGIRQAGLVEVVKGLQEGERVVSEGVQKVRPGGKVKAMPSEGPATAADGRPPKAS